jgi:hypothetical protein
MGQKETMSEQIQAKKTDGLQLKTGGELGFNITKNLKLMEKEEETP